MACIARSLEQPTAIYGITPMINGTAGWRHPSRRSFPWPRSPLATASTSLALERGAPSARHRTAGATRCKKVRTMLNPSYLPVQLSDELFVVVCSFSPCRVVSLSRRRSSSSFARFSLSSFANSMAIVLSANHRIAGA